MKKKNIIPTLLTFAFLQGFAQESTDSIGFGKTDNYAEAAIQTGLRHTQRRKESTASVSMIYQDDLAKRSAKNIANSLFGLGSGLTVLQQAGRFADYEPVFYIRGLQSLSTNSPLILIDGIERDCSDVTPEEVETVAILKDAAAVAIYGHKGINGVINITTKRGRYDSREIKFSYEHSFNRQIRTPRFVNSSIYAQAVNEALTNDGRAPRYSEDELNAYASGKYPYLYPNVNWIDETFRETGTTDNYNISFRGGAQKFRYYAMGNLITNQGFIKKPDMNEGYSTQDQYSRANLRTNLDIDLTPNTKMKLNVLGILSETRTPGSSGNNGARIWESMIYTLPSAAYPVRLKDNTWGGNSTWSGTVNPVAASQAAGYTKLHRRTLFADMTLDQNLSSISPGLGAGFLLSYDNNATYWENHAKTYVYGSDAVTLWDNGEPVDILRYTDGAESALATASEVIAFTRVFNMEATLYYDKAFNKQNKLYAQLKWDYEYRNLKGVDQTWYRQNVSLYGHYVHKEKYSADLALVASASNKLAPGHKWSIAPTVSAGWLLSEEAFVQNLHWIDFLKLRASFGIISTDRLPLSDNTEQTNYWEQTYSGGNFYPFDTNYSVGTGSWTLGRLASLNSTHEKAYKYNFGFDATLFKGLNLSFDAFFEHRTDIWVSSGGKYSSVLGFTAPFENGGTVDSHGFELSADYTRRLGSVKLNIGANVALTQNKIVEQLEEPKLYSNLETTGHRYRQIYGLQAIGFFKDQADIDAGLPQLFGEVKPGDIKYKDVNNDGKIDENDMTAIGYSTSAPELYYAFHLGAEWKGLGFDTQFQGTGRYSAVLNTGSLFWPLINNTTISEEYYNNRWTNDATHPKYPRLTAQGSANNFQTNTLWLADRSFLKLRSVEVYYKLPQTLIKKTKIMNSAKIYVKGIDLLCFDSIKVADPESYGATYPLTRSIVAGISVVF